MHYPTWTTWLGRRAREKHPPKRRGGRRQAARPAPVRPRLEALEDRLAPATHQWVGFRDITDPTAPALWSIDANWVGGSPAGDPNAVLIFPTTARNFGSVNDLGDIPIQEIDLFGSGYIIGSQAGGRILLGSGGINASNASGTNTISAGLTLNGADRAVNVSGPGAQLRLFDVIDGNAGLVKGGLGTLELTGANANTFTGALAVNNGTVRLNKNANGVTAVPGALVIGNTSGSAGTVILDRNDQIADAGAITINRQGVLNLNNHLEGIGPLTLTGGTLNTGVSGLVSLLGNVSATSVSFVPPGGAITIKSAALSGNVGLVNPITFTVGDDLAPDDLIVSANLAGGGALTKAGPGQMRLSGNNGSYSGEITVSASVLRITGASGLGSSAAGTTVQDGATLDIGTGGLTINEPLSLSGAGAGNAGALRFSETSATAPATTLTGNVTLASDTTINVVTAGVNGLRLTGGVSGPGGLTKAGSGLLELSASNSYQSATRVSGGVLRFTNARALGSGTAAIQVDNGATLEAAGTFTMNRPLVLNGLGAGNQGALRVSNTSTGAASTVTWDAPVTLASTAAIGGGSLILSGVLDGPGGLTIEGTVTLSGSAANVYQGTTTVNAGGLVLNKAPGVNAVPGALVVGDNVFSVAEVSSDAFVALAANEQIPDTAPITVRADGVLTVNATETIGPLTLLGGSVDGTGSLTIDGPVSAAGGFLSVASLTLGGDVTVNAGRANFGNLSLGAATRTFTFADPAAVLILGAVSGAPGAGLIKNGPGLLTFFAGGGAAYAAPTVVNGGTLDVFNAQEFLSPVTVNAGGTLTGGSFFGDIGSVAGITATGGTISPGSGQAPHSAAILTSNGDVSLGAASTLEIDLNGTAPGFLYDRLNVMGTPTLGNATLRVNLNFNSAVGDSFVILSRDGTDAITTRFNNGDTFLVAAPNGQQQRFQIRYDGGDGNDVELLHINTAAMAENLRLTPPVIPEGGTVTLTGNLTDPDAGQVLVLEVDWGDGSPVETFEPGTDPFRLTHSYLSSGDYTVHTLWRDDLGEGGSRDLAVTVTDAAPPGGLEGVTVNDGSAQRSMVRSLTVTFTGLVTVEDGAFELRRQDGNLVGLQVFVAALDGKTVAVLTFSGPDVVGGSLADGNYTLVIHGDRIRDDAGQALDADGDGQAGGDRVDAFFRLYGDSDGDRDVAVQDLSAFVGSLGKRQGDAGFLGFFDYDADGDVDRDDLLQIVGRFGTRLPA